MEVEVRRRCVGRGRWYEWWRRGENRRKGNEEGRIRLKEVER